MDKEFIPYAEALALYKIGYQRYSGFGGWLKKQGQKPREITTFEELDMTIEEKDHHGYAPRILWQQAFSWFREKHQLYGVISIQFENEYEGMEEKEFFEYIGYVFDLEQMRKDKIDILPYVGIGTGGFDISADTYEEAQLACLQQLIKLVKDDRS